jgi:beta-phosphoglucomutase
MRWIHDYQLFLFDLDGLLVNTEEIHFKAYQKMCEVYGFKLDWDFNRYCQAAHYHPEKIKDEIYNSLPSLKKQEPSWEVLYAIKKKAAADLLQEKPVEVMPGVEKLLKSLHYLQIKSCVVTHSHSDLVEIVKKQNPILNTIPHWVTREDYTHPKPHPECYSVAINRIAKPHDKIIGFEDTPRGLNALLASKAQAVLISKTHYFEIATFIQKGARHYSSFEDISEHSLFL